MVQRECFPGVEVRTSGSQYQATALMQRHALITTHTLMVMVQSAARVSRGRLILESHFFVAMRYLNRSLVIFTT